MGMNEHGFHIHDLPDLKKPILIAGFSGWGNALQISSAMAAYLVHQLKARKFAEIDPDVYFRYDEIRPRVTVENGIFKDLELPSGEFFAVHIDSGDHDLVVFKGDEPNLRWKDFVDGFYQLCSRLNVESILTLGSMFDHVLHTDRIISAITSGSDLTVLLDQKGVHPISYQGPSTVHSIIHEQGVKRKFACMSLWCHCPFYLQSATHYGMLVHLGRLLAFVGGFDLNVDDLETSWEQQVMQIDNLISNNAKLQTLTEELMKIKKRGMITQLKSSMKPDEKIINISDFLNPK